MRVAREDRSNATDGSVGGSKRRGGDLSGEQKRYASRPPARIATDVAGRDGSQGGVPPRTLVGRGRGAPPRRPNRLHRLCLSDGRGWLRVSSHLRGCGSRGDDRGWQRADPRAGERRLHADKHSKASMAQARTWNGGSPWPSRLCSTDGSCQSATQSRLIRTYRPSQAHRSLVRTPSRKTARRRRKVQDPQ